MLLKSLTYQFYISGVLAAGVLVSTRAYSIPVIDAPLESPVSISSSILESQQQLVWPTLSQDGFVKEVQFHKKRVELLSRFIGEYLGLNSRELILDVAHVHDDAKLTSEMTTELYEMYRDESVSKKATVKKVNDLDREITLNKLKELGLFDGVSIDTKALYAVFVVDLADKIDRAMYPAVLARELYHISNARVNSPEFSRPMRPVRDYLNFDVYADQHYFPDMVRLHKAVDFAEYNYRKWVRNNGLIPTSIYLKACENLLR